MDANLSLSQKEHGAEYATPAITLKSAKGVAQIVYKDEETRLMPISKIACIDEGTPRQS